MTESYESSKNTEVKRDAVAWTPGPWQVQRMVDYDPGMVVSVDKPLDGSPVNVADVQDIDDIAWPGIGDRMANGLLIALAPEMAEAILLYQEQFDEHGDVLASGHKLVAAIADRLRAIGAANV